MQYINNQLKKECIKYASQYLPYKDMSNEPVQQLINARHNYSEIIFGQPPFTDSASNVRYSDWSIYSKRFGIDIRYEAASLTPKNSTLRGKAILHTMESKNIVESQMILVLIGEGYDEVVKYTLQFLIGYHKLPVSIIRSVDEYKKHIDYLFR